MVSLYVIRPQNPNFILEISMPSWKQKYLHKCNTAITDAAMNIECQMNTMKFIFSFRVSIAILILINHFFWRQREKNCMSQIQ